MGYSCSSYSVLTRREGNLGQPRQWMQCPVVAQRHHCNGGDGGGGDHRQKLEGPVWKRLAEFPFQKGLAQLTGQFVATAVAAAAAGPGVDAGDSLDGNWNRSCGLGLHLIDYCSDPYGMRIAGDWWRRESWTPAEASEW